MTIFTKSSILDVWYGPPLKFFSSYDDSFFSRKPNCYKKVWNMCNVNNKDIKNLLYRDELELEPSRESCSYAKYQRLAIKNHSTRGTVIPRIFFACFAHFGTITNNGLMQGTDDLIIHKNDLAWFKILLIF